MPHTSPTDGWTTCDLGHPHWGLVGAAGLLVHRPGPAGPEALLQHRVEWSHHGGTWGTPGGALHEGESATAGALREAGEELGLRPGQLTLGELSVDDHGGWSYSTVLATPVDELDPTSLVLDRESTEVAWVSLADPGVELHPGLAAALPTLLGLVG